MDDITRIQTETIDTVIEAAQLPQVIVPHTHWLFPKDLQDPRNPNWRWRSNKHIEPIVVRAGSLYVIDTEGPTVYDWGVRQVPQGTQNADYAEKDTLVIPVFSATFGNRVEQWQADSLEHAAEMTKHIRKMRNPFGKDLHYSLPGYLKR